MASVAQAEGGKAIVRAVRGSADYSDGSSWAGLKVGRVLHGGAKIRTSPGSSVDLFLDVNGPVVRVTADTELGLDKLTVEQTGADAVIDTQLDLKSGRILGKVNKLAAASHYDIKTPNGVASIKGTEYDISANGTVRILSGSAMVGYNRNGTPSQARVNAGEVFSPAGGVGAIDPQTLKEAVSQIRDSVDKAVSPEATVVIVKPGEPFVSPTNPKGGETTSSSPTGR